jgi:hypothetical protein
VRPQALEVCTRVEHYTAAAKVNKQADFEGLRIYGVLTNMTRFSFYSYDPSTNSFCRDEELIVNTRRDEFSADMIFGMCMFVKVSEYSCNQISVMNKIFGLVLYAFIEGLRAITERSSQRAAKGDVSCFVDHNHDTTNT